MQLLQEGDRFEIFAPAIAIRNPFARCARVVAIEHRSDRIDAQPVDVEALQPMQRAGDQEAADLVVGRDCR